MKPHQLLWIVLLWNEFMELLGDLDPTLVIVGIIIFTWIIWATIKNRGSKLSAEQQKIKDTYFQIRISQTKEDKLDLECFEIQIKGEINAQSDNATVQFTAKMHDEMDGKKEPILSTVKEFQSDDSITFSFSKSEKLPYANSLISEWVTVVKIPLLFLKFPKKGNRNISVIFYIADQQGNVLEKANHQISFFNKENGYLDLIKNRKKFEEVILKTALLVSDSDNEMDSSEAEIIKHWVKIRLTGYDENTRDEHKQRLNGYIKEGFSGVKNDEIDIHSVLDEINDIASDGEKYELYELCLKVASADGKAEQEELDILDDITDYLNLDRVKLQSMLEKELPINIYTSSVDNKESLVGITSDMDKKQIKKHLLKEYSKWNARVAHSDEKIREQTNEMIKIIVELREKYK